MPYLFNEEPIKSMANLLSWLRKDESRIRTALSRARHPKPPIWFRGLRDISRPLLPTFYREGYNVQDEVYLMNLFKQNSHEFLTQVPSSEWEWMFLMRHHGLPSRLIDWTENPLVGLYFAVRPREHDTTNTDGVIWCLLPTQLNHTSLGWPIDDDSLPMFTGDTAEYSRAENDSLQLYLPSDLRGSPSPDARPPAAGISPRTNRRMQIQMGVFTIHHRDNSPVEAVDSGAHVWRYMIPQERKQSIYQELNRIGITERVLFPSLDNVAREAKHLLGGH